METKNRRSPSRPTLKSGVTRRPYLIPNGKELASSDPNARYLSVETGEYIGPVVRWVDDWDGAYDRRGVYCYDGPDDLRGVGVVEKPLEKVSSKAKSKKTVEVRA